MHPTDLFATLHAYYNPEPDPSKPPARSSSTPATSCATSVRERERREHRLCDKRAAGRNKTPKSLLGGVASTVPAQAPVAADQRSYEKPAPAPATDAAAKTAATSWRPRPPSPSLTSPSPPRKRGKMDGEEAQPEVPAAETVPPANHKRRHSVTSSGTDVGEDDGGAASGYTSALRKRARTKEGRTARRTDSLVVAGDFEMLVLVLIPSPMGRADTLK
ncbi:hypothetical protein GGTG_05847 [Gaeumannomyces tritici R3-111a-1]|uniref:Uncharacterized protein n=1 Tax=Gaeumannomyces tritici (strain R3-111a-1) TaxID=644352 RepID=J3NX40_GAET3|nr:hypothetical protein GGTG_05847 [Gaeumannomyces tritici R3-111a-1]EJT75922.1 hypothetical protein GGTG_05847 [Gaeumannomyces tritici R3-111a-1]